MATAITADQVKTLRDKTGAGMMECKAALSEANGNIEDAITVLRKRGVAQAAKRSGRSTGEGLAATRLSSDGRTGVIAEINCESDFVARTEDFQKLVSDVLTALLAVDANADPNSAIAAGSPLAHQITSTITKTGENITAASRPPAACSAPICISAARSACCSASPACRTAKRRARS